MPFSSTPAKVKKALGIVLTLATGAQANMEVYNRIRGDPIAQESRKAVAQYLGSLSDSAREQAPENIRQVWATQGVQHAVLQQAMALLRQTLTQSDGMSDAKDLLRSIGTDLKRFTNTDVSGQIVSAKSLLLGSAAVADIKRLANQEENIAGSLGRTTDNMYSENSRDDKLPGHVYSFVQSMIEKHRDEISPHYFFVFNPSTTWHPEFDNLNLRTPIGDCFLGYHHDLDQLVAFIAEIARPKLGSKPIMHILIPTTSHIAITQSLTFPRAMGSFRITGQLSDSGLPFVYICTPLDQDRQSLRFIDFLKPKPCCALFQRAGLLLPVVKQWLSKSFEPIYFEEPFLKKPQLGHFAAYHFAYVKVAPILPRTQGKPNDIRQKDTRFWRSEYLVD